MQRQSLLHSACAGSSVGLVQRLILHHKCDITAKDDEDNTPLHVAVISGTEDIVLALINEFGCDVNITGHLDRSLLHLACDADRSSMVRCVYQYILPLVADSNGDTPLHLCSKLRRL